MLAMALKGPVTALVLAAFGSCDAVPPPEVDFQFTMQQPVFSRERTSRDLQQIRGETGRTGHVGGLTRNEVSRDITMATVEKERMLGGTCVWPARVVIKVELRPTVWVASEYVDGSCRYNIAYVHELTHVKIARDTLAEFMPGIEQLARAAVASLGVQGPLPAGGAKAAQEAMLATVNGAVTEALDRVNMVLEQRQGVIDTPEAYEAQSRACGSEPLWGRR
jgi:hypothetical protein